MIPVSQLPDAAHARGLRGENLRETHNVLKLVRAAVERRDPDCLLLAEANQSPGNTLSYFGRGDECHRRLRINLGIRRRLAPLLNGDRRRIELMNSLLFSLPGTPVVYYGDEIGMGDNPFLGDRDGVRTPMQWSSDRNAGFSRADEIALYLPPMDSRTPVSLFGGALFPMVGTGPYQLTLSGHSFFWLKLLTPDEARQRPADPREARDQPDLPPSDQKSRPPRRG
jgi:hypothetical protein